MVLRLRLVSAVAVAAALVSAACHTGAPEPIDRALASCVPPDTVLLAGLDLDRIRTAPVYRAMARAPLDAFERVSYLLVASNGREYLLIERGKFTEPPPGATAIGSHLALAGAPGSVQAATAQHRSGRSGAPALLARTSSIPRGRPVWAIMQGGAGLPLSGNLANLNRLIRSADYLTLSAALESGLELDLAAACPNAESAERFEETLRALVSLAAAANARRPDVASLFNSVRVSRDESAVHAAVRAEAAPAAKLLEDMAGR